MAVGVRPNTNPSQSRRFEDPLVSSRAFALLFLVAMSIAILLLFAPKAQAANDLYWDTNGNSSNTGGSAPSTGAGTWGTNNFWNTDSNGGNGTFSTNTANTNDLHFSAGSKYTGTFTVNVSGAQAANSIIFEEGSITLSPFSGATITLGGGGGSNPGLIFNSGTGANTIGVALILGSDVAFTNNDDSLQTIAGGVTGNFNLTLNGSGSGGLLLSTSVNNGGTITNSGTGSGTTTISASIGSSVTGITENSSTSALVLSGANAGYAGPVTLTSGTLQGQNTANTNVLEAFGTGQLNLNGGTLQLRANGASSVQTISVSNNVVVGGNTTIDANNNGANTNNTFSFNTLNIGANTLGITGGNGYRVSFGSTMLTGAATFNPTTGSVSLGSVSGTNVNLTLDGTGTGNTVGAIATGTGGLTKSNTGTWTLSGTSTYTGATNVSGGTLNQIGAFGNTAISLTGGTLSLQTSGAVSQNTITVSGGSLSEGIANALTGTTALTVSSGIATLSQANDFTGTTTLSGGTLQLTNLAAITNSNLVLNGGTLQLNKDSTGGTFADASTSIGANTTINVDRVATLGTGVQLSLGAVSIGANTLTITGGNSYSLSLGATTLTGAATFNPTTANVAIASIAGSNQNLTLGGTSTGNTVGAITTGSGTLTKNTASTWTLSGADTYTGASSISGGTLNQTGTFGNTAISVSGGTLNLQASSAVSQNTVTVNGGALNTTVDNALTGSASLIVSSGTATLGRVGSYTGTTTLSGTGTLVLNFGNAISSSAVSITGGTFTENLPNALSGTTSLSINTAGTVSIGQVNTFTGGTTLTGGTLTLGNTGALGSGSVTVNGGTLNLVTGGATTTFSNLSGTGGIVQITGSGNTGTLSVGSDNSSTMYSGLLKGDTSTGTSTTHLSLTKVGTGSLTLTGASTYNGTTTIQAGTIIAGNNTALGASSVLLGDTVGLSNANLLTSGAVTIANAITLQSGNLGTITLGGNTANASVFSNTILMGSTGGQPAKDATFIALAGGSVDFQGVINENTSTTTVGNVTIGDATHSGTVKFSNAANAYGGNTSITNGSTLEVTKLAAGGTNSSIGNSGTSAAAGAAASLLTLDNGTLKYTGTGDTTNRLFTIGTGGATIDASASANGALNFTGTGSLVASGTGNRTLTLTGSSTGANTMTSVIADPSSGSTSLLKSGVGTWVLGGVNTYTGNTTIANGTLKLAAGNDRLPTSTSVTLGDGSTNSGILQLSDGTTARNQTLTGLTTAGTGTNNRVVGGAAGTSILTLNIAGTNTFNGILGGTGTNENNLALTKTGAGTLVLGGTNTYNGDTTISAGTLQLGAANVLADGTGKGNVIDNGIFDLNGFSETINGLSGSGIVDTVAGGSVTLTVGNNNTTSAFSGSIQNSAGTLALTKTGTGTLALSGANTYTGATTINGGALTVNGTLGNTAVTVGGGTLNLNGGAAISQNTVTVNNVSSAVTENTTNALSGTATLAISNGLVTLSQANDFSGSTTVTGGTLQLGNVGAIANSNLFLNGGTLQLRKDISAGAFADLSTTIGANTTIDVNRNATGTNVQLSLGGPVTIGAFTLGITGGNGYSLGLGPITLTGAATFNPTTASVALNSINGAGQNVTIDGSASGNTVGAITTGTGAVTKTGTSVWTMTGVNTYTGATSVNAGTLNISGTLDNTAVTVGAATLNLNGAAAISQNTLAVNNASGVVTENTTNALTGTAGLAISNGSVVLSQANDFNGSTTLTGGTLQLSNTNAIANSNLTLNGGTLQLRNDSATSFADASTTIAATTTFDVNRLSTGTGVQLSLGPTNITGAFTINITGGNNYVLGLGAVTLSGTTTFNPTTGSVAIASITGTDKNVVLGGTAAGNTVGAITTGAGSLTKNTAGTWTLSGNSTYTGATSVSSGTLNQAGTFGNTAIGVSGGSLSLQNAGAVTLNTVTVNGGTLTETANNGLSGTAALTISSGSATLSNANDYTGATALSGGTLTLGGAGAISGSAVSITGGTFSETTANALSGSASLTINTAGTVTLSQANNFTGSTTVNGSSTLQLTNTGALTNSALVLNGGTLQLRKDTSAGTFNNAGTTIAANATINVDRITTGTGVQLSLGSVSIGAFTLNITGGNTYSLGLGATTLTGNAIFNPTTANVAVASVTGTDKNLILGGTITTGVNSVGAITTGAGTVTKNTASTWTLSGNSTYTGATSITTGTLNQTGAFGNTAIGLTGGTLNLQAVGAVTQNTLTVNGGTLTETVGNALSGTASLAISSGTVTLSQPNSYTGNTTLSGGTLNLNGPGAINGSAVSVTGGTLSETAANALTGSTSLSLSIPGTFVMSQANNYTGSTTLNSGTLQLTNTGAITNSALILNGGILDLRKDSSAGTFSNAGTTIAADTTINVDRITSGTGIQLSLGSVSIGGFTLNITGANTYSLALGPTTLTGNSTFNPTTANVSIASLTGTDKNVTLGGTSTGNSVGAITTGAGGVTKNTASTWTLSGNSTYTGATSISSGTLNQAGTFGNTAISLTGGTLSLQAAGAVSQNTLTITGGTFTESVANGLSGSASLLINTAGTLTLSLANNYNGSTTLNSGTLQLANTGAIANSNLVLNAGTLQLRSNTAGTFSTAGVAVGGNTTIDVARASTGNGNQLSLGAMSLGAFTLNITGANNYTLAVGATTLTGAATFNPTTASVSIASITGANQNLTLSGTASGNNAGAVTTGTGALTKSGTGTWTLTGTNTYTGATNVNAGTLNITGVLDNTAVTVGTAALGLNGTGAVSQNTVTLNNAASTLTESATNALTGSASLVINNGSATLSQANNYTGSTTLAAGTLQLGNFGSMANSALTLNGGTLQLRNDAAGLFADASTTIGANTTIDVNRSSSGTGLQLTLGATNITGAFTLNVTGGNGYGLGLGATTINGTTVFNPTSASVAIASINGTNRDVTLDGSAAGNTVGAINTGTGAVTKTGTSVWTMTGVNTYTGATNVNGGTLTVTGVLDNTAVTVGAGTLNLNGASAISQNTLTVNNAGGAVTENTTNALTGTATLAINNGSVTLSRANDYTGSTTLAGGTLQLGNFGAISNSALSLNGGILQLRSDVAGLFADASTTIGANTTIDVNQSTTGSGLQLGLGATNSTGAFTLNVTGGNGYSLGLGATTINGTTVFNPTTASVAIASITGTDRDVTLDGSAAGNTVGAINTGTGAVTKTGTSIWTMTGANVYTGATNVNGGTLNITGVLDNTAVTVGAASLNLNGASAISQNTLTVNNANSLVTENTANALSGTANLTINNGSVLLTQANNYSGTTVVNGGMLMLSDAAAMANSNLSLNGGMLELRNDANTSFAIGSVTIGADTTIDVDRVSTGNDVQLGFAGTTIGAFTVNVTGGNNFGLGLGAVTLTGSATFNPTTADIYIDSITGTGYDVTLGGTAADNDVGPITTGAGSVTKSGASTWTISGSSTYTGGTNINGGTLVVNNSDAIGTTGTIALGGGTLRYGSGNTTDYSGRFSTAPNQAYNIDTNGNNVMFSSGLTSSAGTLTKMGAGTLTLTGNNTFAGTTTINGGTLNANAIGGDKALGGTTNIIVNAGGTLLTSSEQQVNAAASVTLAGGTIATNGTSQTLGALTLSSTAIIDMGDGASILNFANSSSQLWAANTIISVYNWSGDRWNGGGTDQLFFGNDATGLTSGQLSQFQFYSDAGLTPIFSGGVILSSGEVVAVPEPATWLGALLALSVIGYTQRRRLGRLIKRRDVERG